VDVMGGDSSCEGMCMGDEGGIGEGGISGVCGGLPFRLDGWTGGLGISGVDVQLSKKTEESGGV
jgi:hypothetical protein